MLRRRIVIDHAIIRVFDLAGSIMKQGVDHCSEVAQTSGREPVNVVVSS